MTGQLEGKRVVMTGAAHGIGRATANETAAEINAGGSEATFVRTDVGDPVEMAARFDVVTEQLGGIGVPGAVAYSASKGAVIAMSKALAREEAKHGIRVNAVCPGWVDTGFNDPIVTVMGGPDAHEEIVAGTVADGRQSSAEEIAPAFVFLASDASSYLTAQAIVVDGGNS